MMDFFFRCFEATRGQKKGTVCSHWLLSLSGTLGLSAKKLSSAPFPTSQFKVPNVTSTPAVLAEILVRPLPVHLCGGETSEGCLYLGMEHGTEILQLVGMLPGQVDLKVQVPNHAEWIHVTVHLKQGLWNWV